jgi:hypothetical protein
MIPLFRIPGDSEFALLPPVRHFLKTIVFFQCFKKSSLKTPRKIKEIKLLLLARSIECEPGMPWNMRFFVFQGILGALQHAPIKARTRRAR